MLDTCINENAEKQISWEYSSLVNEFYFKEQIAMNDVSSIAKQVIKDPCSYNQLTKYVVQYCLKHGIKDKNQILLNVLDTIDSLT